MSDVKMDLVTQLRQVARKLIRELGILELGEKGAKSNRTPQHWHALIEIYNEPKITIAKLRDLLLMSYSAVFRTVDALIKEGLVESESGVDKREKYLQVTEKGKNEIKKIDEYSNKKILGALKFLTLEDQREIVDGIGKYANALEQSRTPSLYVKIHTLSTSRTIRKQIVSLIEDIQKNEFGLSIADDANVCVLRAEEDFYYYQSYNFWYAADETGAIIGSIGLKRIDEHNAEIKKFFVHQSYRGTGVSDKLMQKLLQSALKHHFKYLYLGTVEILHAAHAFYKKNGFSQIPETKLPEKFEKFPLDMIFFKKIIGR